MMTGLPQFSAHPWKLNAHPPVFRAFVLRVVDGDTLDVLADQGFATYNVRRLRLRGVDTPEVGSHAKTSEERTRGEAAAARVATLVLARPVLVRTYADAQSYERFVADVLYFDAAGGVHDLATLLRTEGLLKAVLP